MRELLTTALALLLLTSFGARAQADPACVQLSSVTTSANETRNDRRTKLLKVLRQKSFPSEEQIRTVGSDVDSILATIINNRELDQPTRVRAVWCLKYFKNKRARLLVRSIVTDPMWLKPFKIAAVVAMGYTHGDEAFDTVRDSCNDSDADLRLACIKAMDVMGGQNALNLLRSMQVRERDSDVMSAIDKVIKKLARPAYPR